MAQTSKANPDPTKENNWVLVDQEMIIDGHTLSFGQVYVLMEMTKGADERVACKVFHRRPPTFKSSVSEKVLENLSKQGLVEGTIKRGQTSWRLTKEGREISRWVQVFLQMKANEIEADKATKRALSFDEKIRCGYYSIDNETSSEFKADLLADEGVTDNPLADDAYQMAWEDGHSAGYSEVRNCFYDLAELIRKASRIDWGEKRGA